jgi:hypothetical protein
LSTHGAASPGWTLQQSIVAPQSCDVTQVTIQISDNSIFEITSFNRTRNQIAAGFGPLADAAYERNPAFAGALQQTHQAAR